MLAVLLALASAAGYGASDFAAGLAARRASVLMVTFIATVCSLVLTVMVLPWAAGHAPSAAALGWGVAAGLGGMSGALALYLGFRHAAFSVAGPISAVSAAGLAVIVGVLLGERPPALSLAGIAVALPAIVLVSLTAAPPGETSDSATPDPAAAHPATHRTWPGVAWGLAAGTGFALLFVGLNRAGSGAGIWPVFSGVAAESVVLACLVALTRGFRNILTDVRSSDTAVLALLTGVTGSGATIAYFFATQHGFLAITAVLTSLYPAITIGLARALVHERLSATRLAGLILAGASVTLIALGGSA
ncbi:MAG TPA: DMT family transporter [Streptosporangiaceae bacterium]|jgi:drug/metabolite transporter (DMT)-like permease